MALPKSAANDNDNDSDEKKFNRDPFPDEIESEEEKNHILKKYNDIASQLEEIRVLHMDGVLFEANTKSDDLLQYITKKYSNLVNEYETHPRRILIKKHLKETNRMLDFMTSTEKWELFKETGTWKTEWQQSDDSDFESFRLTGVGDVTLYNILAVIYEMDLMKSWMPLCKESKELGQLSLICKCGYIRLGLWPAQDRETILFGYGVDDLKNGKVLIYFDSREDHDPEHIKIPKCPKGRVRVDVFLGGFYFERLTENKTKITVVWNADAKIALVPTWMINWFAGTFAGSLVSCIVNAAKFNEKSDYAKRIRENEEFYGKVKRKLAENKTMQDLKKDVDDKNDVDDDKNDVDDDKNDGDDVDDEKEQKRDDNDNDKIIAETKDYVFKSIDIENNKIVCLDDDFNNITFTLDSVNKQLLGKIKKCIDEGKKQQKDVMITVNGKNDNNVQIVCDVKIA